MSISRIQNCYQLLQTRPTGEKRYQLLQTTHPSATNPQPFCLPGDDCQTYGRLTDPKKNPPSKSLLEPLGSIKPLVLKSILNNL